MAKKTKIDLMELKAGEDPESASSGQMKKLKKKSILIFGMAGLVLLGGGMGAAGYLGLLPVPGLSHPKKIESRPKPAKRQEMGPTVKLGPLTINLNEEGGRSYLKTTIILELDKKERGEEIQSKLSSLTDLVILAIGDKKLEELRQPNFKEDLKKELLAKMNERIGHETITQIYFDEFLFQ